MKLLAFIIVMLFAGISLTLLAMENPGYVLLARPPWSVEMPLTLFGVFFALALLLGYGAIYAAVRVWRIPREVTRWRQLRHARRAQEGLYRGLLHLAEGSWTKAEKRLVSDLRYHDHPLINYLAAACAAQGQGDLEKRGEYLARAHAYGSDQQFAVGMMQAQLHILSQQREQAAAILNDLRARDAEHAHVLRLLVQIYRELEDWTNLVNIVPDLRKYKIYGAEELARLELETHRALLSLSLPPGSLDILQRSWRLVPAPLRTHPTLIEVYARQLARQGDPATAIALVNDALARAWDVRLAVVYCETVGAYSASDATTALITIENHAREHTNDPLLLLALGRLAAVAKQKPKAREYFEKSLGLRATVAAYRELAELLEQAGQTEKARECYRKALDLSAGAGNGTDTERARDLMSLAVSRAIKN